jgi:hypothetical protein
VLYFSWDAVKGTSGSDYIESVVFILMVGFLAGELPVFSALAGLIKTSRKEKKMTQPMPLFFTM